MEAINVPEETRESIRKFSQKTINIKLGQDVFDEFLEELKPSL